MIARLGFTISLSRDVQKQAKMRKYSTGFQESKQRKKLKLATVLVNQEAFEK